MDSELEKRVSELLARAEQLANARDWSGAADLCLEARSLVPANLNVLDKLGWYLSRAKRYEESAAVFRELVDREPTKAKWRYMVGYQYYDQSLWKEAVDWFDQALGLWDAYMVVLYRKGVALTQLNDTDAACEMFQKCISLWKALTGQQRDREAKNYSDACFQLGKVFLSKGQSRKAEQVFTEAVQYDPDDANKHYELGKAYLKNGKCKEALEQFTLADRIEPGKEYILDYISRVYIALGDYELAEATFARIPAGRRKPYVWHDLADLALKRGQPKQAIDYLQKAISRDGQNHNHQYLLGQASEACQDFKTAYTAYKRAVALREQKYHLDFPEAQERLVAVQQYAQANGIDLNGDGKTKDPPRAQIILFKRDRGFGFISLPDGQKVFFHISDVKNREAIKEGAEVEFSIEESPKGPRARNVVISCN